MSVARRIRAGIAAVDPALRIKLALTRFHPQGRAWLDFLDSLPLDPDRLPRPLPPPGARDFILCGAPRSGTTLLTAMLFQPPRVVTVMEPWCGLRLEPRELFRTIRSEIETTGALSVGKLDVAALRAKEIVRWIPEGSATHAISTEPDYLLVVKWPSFYRYMDHLPETKFLVCLRDPREVVASFKKSGGRLRAGLEYDVKFNRSVNQELKSRTKDLALRRVLLYERVYSSILPHLSAANVMTVRYERWFTESDALLREIGEFLGTRLNHGPARIHAPNGRPSLSSREVDLIARHCPSAAAMGYPA